MTLGDRYTDNIESIYQVSINLIIQTLIEGYEQAEQAHNKGGGGGGGSSNKSSSGPAPS